MRETIRTAAIVVASVLLFLSVFSSSFASLLFDRDFYLSEHEKTGSAAALGNATSTAMTDELIGYLKARGELSTHFNERERLHLSDVRALITKGFVVHYFILVLLIVLFVYLYFQRWFLSAARSVFLYTGGAVVVFSIISFALQGLFQRGFILFHEAFFTNDLWLLNPATDKLIVLLPQQFFRDFVIAVYLESLSIAVLLIGFGALLHLFSRRSEGFK